MTVQAAYDKPITVITVACEASNRSYRAKVLIVHTIMNRRGFRAYPKTMAGVCLQRMQFSEWNADACSNGNLLRVANMPSTDPVIVQCERAYVEALSDAEDPTNGSTHFYSTTIPEPYWAKDATLEIEEDAIRFYSNVP